jgi:hypothetical protein
MPVISRFLGLAIYMYWNDHNPPHIHVIYGDYELQLNIESFEVIQGELPPNKLNKLVKWCRLNQES